MAEVSLTATIHKTGKTVLWVETDKNFIDFLFCLYSIPMGQVLNFLSDNVSFGCLRKPYQSVQLMEKDFMVCDKDDILKPKVHLSPIPSLLKIENNSIVVPYTTLDLFTCQCGLGMLSKHSYACQYCKRKMDIRVKHYVPDPNSNPTSVDDGERDGFVKGGGAKYIVTDDLSVSSKSSFSSLAYFNAMNIVALNELEEKVVNVNIEKCKKLLKLALTSNHMVLTNLFKDELGF